MTSPSISCSCGARMPVRKSTISSGIPGVTGEVPDVEGVAEGAGATCAENGTTASKMAPSTKPRPKLHFHPTHFISIFSLRLFWMRLPGTRRFVALHYTHARRPSQFEIFMCPIRFSDAWLSCGSGMSPVSSWNGSLCATYPPAYNAVRKGERPSQPNEDRLKHCHD
jgi:hypothetical protein